MSAKPKLGFGEDLPEGEPKAPTKVPAFTPKRAAKPRQVEPDEDALAQISEDAGFTAPAPRPAKKRPKAKKAPTLPVFAAEEHPLDYNYPKQERAQIAIPGPKIVIDRFKNLRNDMGQSSWVMLNALVAHWENNPPDGIE